MAYRASLWTVPTLALIAYLLRPLASVIDAVASAARWAWEVAFPADAARWRPTLEAAADPWPVQRARTTAFLARVAARSPSLAPAGVALRLAI